LSKNAGISFGKNTFRKTIETNVMSPNPKHSLYSNHPDTSSKPNGLKAAKNTAMNNPKIAALFILVTKVSSLG
jgi:hypothetical protein